MVWFAREYATATGDDVDESHATRARSLARSQSRPGRIAVGNLVFARFGRNIVSFILREYIGLVSVPTSRVRNPGLFVDAPAVRLALPRKRGGSRDISVMWRRRERCDRVLSLFITAVLFYTGSD